MPADLAEADFEVACQAAGSDGVQVAPMRRTDRAFSADARHILLEAAVRLRPADHHNCILISERGWAEPDHLCASDGVHGRFEAAGCMGDFGHGSTTNHRVFVDRNGLELFL